MATPSGRVAAATNGLSFDRPFALGLRRDISTTAIPVLQRKDCGCGCQGEESCLARKEAPGGLGHAAASLANPVLHSGAGHPLDRTTRTYFDARFGHDFSRVRVHHDARAAEMARSVGARAFTVGSDVVFGQGEYAPASSEGRRLLAHELVHTIQQGGTGAAPAAKLPVSQPGDSLEREADRVAAAVMEPAPPATGIPAALPSQRVSSAASGRVLLQRQPSGAAEHECGPEFKDAAHAHVKAEPGGKALRAIYTKIPTKDNPQKHGEELAVATPLIVGQLSPSGIWRAVCYQPSFRPGGWEIGWIPNYYVEYTKRPGTEEAEELREQREKQAARKKFRHGLKKLVEHERTVAAGGKPHGKPPSGAESMEAFAHPVRSFQAAVGMMPFDSIEQLLRWSDEAIAWADEHSSKPIVRRFRLYREAIVEEYEAQQVASMLEDAKEALAELDAAIAEARDQGWIDILTAPPPALDPRKSRYAAVAKMVSPVTGPLWTALVVSSDIVADFIPIIGQVKGGIEAFTGKSISGQYLLTLERPAADPDALPQDLEPWARALAALPGACDAASAIVKGGKAAGPALVRMAMRTGKPIREVARLTTRLATLKRAIGSVPEAVAKLKQAIDLRWATRTLGVGADIAKNLAVSQLAGLRKLFERLGSAAVEKFRGLSQAMKAALLGCRSKCKVNLALIEKQLATAAKAKGLAEGFLKQFPDIVKGLPNQTAIRESIEVLLGSGAVAADDLAKIIANARGTGVSRVLGYMEKARNVPNVVEVFSDLAKGGNFFTGAEWVLRWIDKNKKWADLKKFEVAGAGRYWDALIGDVLYQFKSWQTFNSTTFVNQFTKDLTQKAPDKIAWVFEQSKAIGDVPTARTLMENAIRSSKLDPAEKVRLLSGLKDVRVVVSR